ncbi:glycoside hydrolase family 2 TIM barrel-domain containing protein [Anaerosporobacter faecicola]|uniref:glycoside hydrolase family 2 TIM barrel-domain containing protein n=1 Tax=Anaerosporobacter faecicola TaxID=2718714 RepID=UPI00143C3B63|nr:glycoside hydrolase family 2 TIM barrel-domain containing protein [Anaerosporobacter faecicola]
MDKTIISLNQGWRFVLVRNNYSSMVMNPYEDETEDAWYKGWDDASYTSVNLPHDWSVTGPFDKRNSSGTGYLQGGIAWYRLHFNIPENYKGKRIRIHFDGVYKNSHVWINSYDLGKHPNGYTPFSYDITPFACFGETENVLCVKVSHLDVADSRWFTGSGMTRGVSLIVEEAVHAAEDGIYSTTIDASEAYAHLVIHHEIVNEKDIDEKITVETRIRDQEGKIVLDQKNDAMIIGGTTKTFQWNVTMPKPNLWNCENPYLYTMESMYHTNRESYVADVQKIGIRTIQFDAEKGFFLNGVETKLKGVCVHHDAGVLGAAVTKEVWKRRLLTLKECGCNAIRCSHNPHMPQLYELCDELGFLMMDEAFDEWETPKNKWSVGHNVYPPKHQGYAEDFAQWHEKDLRDMVRRDRKHPAVIMWSIGNEIDYPNDPYCHSSFQSMTGNNDANKPAEERIYDPNKPDATRMVAIARELSNIVKEEDESRPVTMALAFPELSATLGIFDSLDVVGYNYKEHLYEQDHKTFQAKPFIGSENNHTYAAWKTVKDNSYISGQFLWTGIDYLGEASGWPIHGSSAGLMDLAGFPKHRFLARKSYWQTAPFIGIATREAIDVDEEWIPCQTSWNYELGQKVIIRCYSNQPRVCLYLNDKRIGEQAGYNKEGWYQFEIDYEPGVILAEGKNEEGEVVCVTNLSTTGKAAVLAAKLWKDDSADYNIPDTIGYIYQVEVSLLDQEGKVVQNDEHVITAEVQGVGELLGLENGNLSDNTSYTEDARMTLNGHLLVYIRRNGLGNIRLLVKAEGMRDEKVELMFA